MTDLIRIRRRLRRTRRGRRPEERPGRRRADCPVRVWTCRLRRREMGRVAPLGTEEAEARTATNRTPGTRARLPSACLGRGFFRFAHRDARS